MEDEAQVPDFEEEHIARIISQYYTKLFTSASFAGSQTVFNALEPCGSRGMNELFIRGPSPTEIKALLAIHADKAPGPDGISATFFQSNWETVGPAIVLEIQQSFSSGSMPTSLNKIHVRLIPKFT